MKEINHLNSKCVRGWKHRNKEEPLLHFIVKASGLSNYDGANKDMSNYRAIKIEL